MAILITGAQMGNKGAQSMLYITVDELRRRFPDQELLFMTTEHYPEGDYRFQKLNAGYWAGRIAAASGLERAGCLAHAVARDSARFLLGRRGDLFHYSALEQRKDIDAVVDICGFNIGTQWSRASHIAYLDRIRFAKKRGIPICLMPQSFGPFDYTGDMAGMERQLAEALRYPQLIFAREPQGQAALKALGVESVLSTDLVLQNRGIDLDNVFTTPPVLEVPGLPGTGFVGIVPNLQCFAHGQEEEILSTYRRILRHLVDRQGKQVVIFRHSSEDMPVVRKIHQLGEGDPRIHMAEENFSCLAYDRYVRQFDYILCSRFHGIVHAYRNGVPAIALGWAIKYQELAKAVGQGDYVFDLTGGGDAGDILSAMDRLSGRLDEEQATIRQHVAALQQANCFDRLEETLRACKVM